MTACSARSPASTWPIRPSGLATERAFSRQAQDAYALQSHERAIGAQDAGFFAEEIVQLDELAHDAPPRRDSSAHTLGSLQPTFSSSGTITAGNASKLADGAALILLASSEAVKRATLTPLARIDSSARVGVAPNRMGLGASVAALACLAKAKRQAASIDAWEINEAFAAQMLVSLQELGLDASKVNTQGGAIALGHPLGASGARILVTLLHSLLRSGRKTGLASLCVGGGQGSAMLIERI